MADFTFAIVVPLASPIQTVATSKHDHDTEYTSRPLISQELRAFRTLRWSPSSRASIAQCHALVWRV